MPLLRSHAQRIISTALARRATLMSEDELSRSALVVAPHPDDETLGCGGTIARKRQLGADVSIVFMTDGSRSHPGRIEPDALRGQRREEAIAAAAALGVAERDLVFLDLPDGRLAAHVESAQQRLTALLRERAPVQLFAPYRHDPPPDHRAAWMIAASAMRSSGCDAVLHEYPVWFWEHWPWGPAAGRGPRAALRTARRGAAGALRLLRDFRCAVDVAGVLPAKRAALTAHRSQTMRPPDHPEWPVLADVWDGGFLDRFTGDREWFRVTAATQLG